MADQTTPPRIILASTSAYRAAALQQLGVTFEQVAPGTDETQLAQEPGPELAQRLARAKASALISSYPQAIIIGSDQVGVGQHGLLHKPGSTKAAIEQLSRLSGSRALFHTAVCIYDPARGECFTDLVDTEVVFRNLSKTQIERYVAIDEPINCAGSFKIEALGIALFDRVVSTDPSALVGLPLICVAHRLLECGIDVLA